MPWQCIWDFILIAFLAKQRYLSFDSKLQLGFQMGRYTKNYHRLKKGLNPHGGVTKGSGSKKPTVTRASDNVAVGIARLPSPAHFFNCLIQSNDLEGWFCGPQIHCITCRAPVTTRCFGCFLSLMTGATLKCKQFSCDLADEKVKSWGPQNVPPSITKFETLEGAIKERCTGMAVWQSQ